LLRPDLSVKGRLAGPEVGFRCLDELGLLVEFPEEEEAKVDRDDDVSATGRVSRGDEEVTASSRTYAVTKSWMDQLDSPVTAS
jgi:hypothetical protein